MLTKSEYVSLAYKTQRALMGIILRDKFTSLKRATIMNTDIEDDPTAIAQIDEENTGIDDPAAVEAQEKELEAELRLAVNMPENYAIFVRGGAVSVVNIVEELPFDPETYDTEDNDPNAFMSAYLAYNKDDYFDTADNTVESIRGLMDKDKGQFKGMWKYCNPVSGVACREFLLNIRKSGTTDGTWYPIIYFDINKLKNKSAEKKAQEEVQKFIDAVRKITVFKAKLKFGVIQAVNNKEGLLGLLDPDHPKYNDCDLGKSDYQEIDFNMKYRMCDEIGKPDEVHSPNPGQDDEVFHEKDIEGTEPQDPPLEHEIVHTDVTSTDGPVARRHTLFPGMQGYMEEDTIQEVPIPTKEEGHSPDPEIEDLDDVSPKEPDNTDIVIEINQNRDPERTVALANMKSDILFQLRDFDNKIKNFNMGYIGQEDFTDHIKNFLVGSVNILASVGNLFKTGVMYGWRDFKRSELTVYSENNRLTMARLYNADYFRVEELNVPIPQGMKGNYKGALSSLLAYLNSLNMPDRAKKMEASIESIYKDMHKTNPVFVSQVRDIRRTYTDPQMEKLYKDTANFFTADKRRVEDKFSKLFDTMAEYEWDVKTGIDADSHLRQVAGVYTRLENIQMTVGKIIDDHNVLNKSQVEDLSKVIRGMAECFESYGVVCTDLVRTQHNLVEVTKVIRSELNM